MAEKINVGAIKQFAFSGKTVKDFSTELASKDSRLEIGSAAALIGGMAASSLLLAVRKTGSEELGKTAEDIELLRKYFIFLVDEEVKAKEPLESRLRQGVTDEAEIEGGYRTACIILSEQLYTLVKLIDIAESVSDRLCPCTAVESAAAMYYIKTALESIRLKLAFYATKMTEPVFARTTKREPEIVIEDNAARISALIAKFEAPLK